MGFKRFSLIALISGLAFGTAACTDGYGYGGASLGYGSAYYADPYYADAGWGGYGPGYGSTFGWYNDFYYPGTGVYVYDRFRRPHRWNDAQRRYWQGRPGWNQPGARANWNDFRRDYRAERRDLRRDLRENREDFRNGTINRDQFRQGRQDARRDFRRDVRQDWRELRRDNRADGVRTPGLNRGRDFNRGPGINRGSGGRGANPRGAERPR
ncbi:hypothetical protein [Sphingomonas sp. IC4-52]|uniref:hypothetical protein n=1 Tax=Sphingomonas sp. IC4-52 TaxID=2887202 RepID=UPI001D10D196|nr:hypothetical protein [Sphingomonas sp. IC4-52]MCC2979260.1 hypothetical protein [Sphingomonas sp. IC4-52]